MGPIIINYNLTGLPFLGRDKLYSNRFFKKAGCHVCFTHTQLLNILLGEVDNNLFIPIRQIIEVQ